MLWTQPTALRQWAANQPPPQQQQQQPPTTTTTTAAAPAPYRLFLLTALKAWLLHLRYLQEVQCFPLFRCQKPPDSPKLFMAMATHQFVACCRPPSVVTLEIAGKIGQTGLEAASLLTGNDRRMCVCAISLVKTPLTFPFL